MFAVYKRFLSSIVDEYGEHSVSTDGGWVHGIHSKPAGF
jgi:hypothetical protein